ncbi:MAG TPA: hypothetical protein VHB93_00645 [Candidatus Paceibacterota bacterium]|nr:hypothetical protein [Candidatus Paceibacterota bacterium]
MVETDIVRISVAALAPRLVLSSGSRKYAGIFNVARYNAHKPRLLQPLGGVVELTPEGRGRLEEEFHAGVFAERDARFVVPARHVEGVLRMFEEQNPAWNELDPIRECREELTQREFRDQTNDADVILWPEVFERITFKYVDTMRQPLPEDGVGTSPNAGIDIPTRRLFYRYDLRIDEAIWEALMGCRWMRSLTSEELATTQGGRRAGSSIEGIQIADNFIPFAD